MRIAVNIILLLVISSFGCQKSISEEPKIFSLKMGRYHCHGYCPVYNLSVQSDGSVFFEGIEFTKMIGHTEGNVSKEKVNELISEIKKANFFSFKDDYSSQSKNCNAYATDGPGVILTVKFDEIEKTINHSSNCFVNNWLTKENELKTLTNLENKIDEIVETKRWIGEGK